VTDASRGSALAIIRSLGRAGWRVIAADAEPRSLGSLSRYAAAEVVVPSPEHAPAAYAASIRAALAQHAVELLIPVSDEALHPLAAIRGELERSCRIAAAAPEAIAVASDKARTFALAESLGVPIPRTRVVRSAEEAREAARELAWPLVVKPAVSRLHQPERGIVERFSVSYAADEGELSQRVAGIGGRQPILLQELCPGAGSGVELLAWRGRPLLAFQHRRLAELPITGGASAWRESVPLDPMLYEYSRRLVAALEWTGLLMVEFKLGERPVLMEINGRVWGSLPLAVASGVDFPRRWAELCLDGPPPEAALGCDYRVGVRAYDLEKLWSWIAKVALGGNPHPYLARPARWRALQGLGAMLDPRGVSDFFAWDDLAPGLVQPARIARKWLRKSGARGPAPLRPLGARGGDQSR